MVSTTPPQDTIHNQQNMAILIESSSSICNPRITKNLRVYVLLLLSTILFSCSDEVTQLRQTLKTGEKLRSVVRKMKFNENVTKELDSQNTQTKRAHW